MAEVAGTWYQTAAHCVYYFDCFTCLLPGVASWVLISSIKSILCCVKHKFGYTTEVINVTDMLQNVDNKLFLLMFRSGHCLHTLLPDLKMIDRHPLQLWN